LNWRSLLFNPAKTKSARTPLVLALILGWQGVGVAALPFLLLPLGGGVVQAQDVPAVVRQGYTLLGRNLVNDAIAVFKQAVDRYPSSLEAKLGLAIAYRRAGRDADAWQTYQQVLTQDPNNQLALRTVGTLGGFRPEWQNAGIAALTTLLTLVPNDLDAHAQRALLYGYQGRFPEALADYEIALRGNPAPAIILGAAQVYTYAGDAPQGLALFERYRRTTKQPLTGNAVIAYARALRETGNVAEAMRILAAALPKQTNAYAIQIRSELSQTYLANRQPTQALAVLDPLRGRGDARLPLARALNELGRQQGRPELSLEAAQLYRAILNETPNPSPALAREVADVLSGVPQERQTALQLYRQLVQQTPNDKVLQIQKIALESELGSLSKDQARAQLRGILQPLPNSPAQQLAIAQALVRLEPDPEFLSVYQSLIQAGVNEPFLYFRLAQILIEQNDFRGAQTALAAYQATPIGARDQAPELLLAEIERRQGNLEASAQRYQALITSGSPDTNVVTAAMRGLAGIRLSQNRPQEALSLYDQLLASYPDDWSVKLGRAAIAYQTKQITAAQAEVVINQFLQARPAETPPELYTLVGALPPSAQREALYTALIAADPNNAPVQVRWIQLLATRNPAQAQVQANRLLARVRSAAGNDARNVSLLLLRGQLAQALGNLDQAGDAYQAILSLEPDNVDALSALGGIRFQQRQFEAADRLYSQVLAFRPDDVTAQRSLAELTAVQGKPLEAMDRFEQIKIQQTAQGGLVDGEINQRLQQLQEDLLQQRGFQPPWERY
jgi:cellulose synthase operon protein C